MIQMLYKQVILVVNWNRRRFYDIENERKDRPI